MTWTEPSKAETKNQELSLKRHGGSRFSEEGLSLKCQNIKRVSNVKTKEATGFGS